MKGRGIRKETDVMTTPETQTSIKNKLGAASLLSDGYVKAEDFVKFADKQNKIVALEVFRTADLNFAAGTFADILVLDLTAGTCLILASLSIKSPLNLGQKVVGKIWDGTTVFASGETSNGALGINLASWAHLHLSKILTLESAKTIKLSAASSAASILSATVGDHSSGANNTANSLRAIKIG